MKYYFYEQWDDEHCYSRQYFIEEMLSQGLTEVEVFPAQISKDNGYAFCSEFFDVVETRSGDCGISCESYAPRNGKNGRCRFSKSLYEPSDNPITLRVSRATKSKLN